MAFSKFTTLVACALVGCTVAGGPNDVFLIQKSDANTQSFEEYPTHEQDKQIAAKQERGIDQDSQEILKKKSEANVANAANDPQRTSQAKTTPKFSPKHRSHIRKFREGLSTFSLLTYLIMAMIMMANLAILRNWYDIDSQHYGVVSLPIIVFVCTAIWLAKLVYNGGLTGIDVFLLILLAFTAFLASVPVFFNSWCDDCELREHFAEWDSMILMVLLVITAALLALELGDMIFSKKGVQNLLEFIAASFYISGFYWCMTCAYSHGGPALCCIFLYMLAVVYYSSSARTMMARVQGRTDAASLYEYSRFVLACVGYAACLGAFCIPSTWAWKMNGNTVAITIILCSIGALVPAAITEVLAAKFHKGTGAKSDGTDKVWEYLAAAMYVLVSIFILTRVTMSFLDLIVGTNI